MSAKEEGATRIPEPSARYKFARNPAAAISAAIVEQCNATNTNPRLCWRAISTRVNAQPSEGLTPKAFSDAVKVGRGKIHFLPF